MICLLVSLTENVLFPIWCSQPENSVPITPINFWKFALELLAFHKGVIGRIDLVISNYLRYHSLVRNGFVITKSSSLSPY